MGDNLTKHHIKPTSRFGENASQTEKDKDNIVKWDKQFHQRWHTLFSNLTLSEIHAFIDIVSEAGREWTSKDLHVLKNEIKAQNGDFDIEQHLNKYKE